MKKRALLRRLTEVIRTALRHCLVDSSVSFESLTSKCRLEEELEKEEKLYDNRRGNQGPIANLFALPAKESGQRPQTRSTFQNHQSSNANKFTGVPCSRCGKTGHDPNECRVFLMKIRCHSCGQMGHLRTVCRTAQKGPSTNLNLNMKPQGETVDSMKERVAKLQEEIKKREASDKPKPSAPTNTSNSEAASASTSERPKRARLEELGTTLDEIHIKPSPKRQISVLLSALDDEANIFVTAETIVDPGADAIVIGYAKFLELQRSLPKLKLEPTNIRVGVADKRQLTVLGGVTFQLSLRDHLVPYTVSALIVEDVKYKGRTCEYIGMSMGFNTRMFSVCTMGIACVAVSVSRLPSGIESEQISVVWGALPCLSLASFLRPRSLSQGS
eukprot:GHVU01039972.1.p1 GENE.GHVU01039972.1~~GHVU01039972.1.p1  ORF type:complete len:387 (+),score=13.05 GHVU01039972.1:224-1384(+)